MAERELITQERLQVGAWRIVSRDSVGKRALALCASCGSTRELAVSALESGEHIACPACDPPRYSLSPAVQSRRFATDVAGLEDRGAYKCGVGG